MDQYEKLKLQIDELETLNEGQANLITELTLMVDKITEENCKLKEQLAEKDKRIKELKGKHTVVIPARMNGKTRLCRYNLLKIQNEQAIEELEKLRETLPEKNDPIYPITILKQIDKQLYELRGGDYVKNV